MKIKKVLARYLEIIYVEENDNDFSVFAYSGGHKVDLGSYSQDQIDDVIFSYKQKGYDVKTRKRPSFQTSPSPLPAMAKQNKNWYKQARPVQRDFTSVDVRRMSGIFEDFQSLSNDAIQEMNKWRSNGEYDITPEEAQKRLSYYLARMGIE